MTTFTISKQDILNSEIRPLLQDAYGPYYFTTHTESGFLGLKTTFLKLESHSSVNTPLIGGSIDWREKTFEIGGAVKELKTVMHTQGLILRTYVETAQRDGGNVLITVTRPSEWCWTGPRYTVKRENKQWTVRLRR